MELDLRGLPLSVVEAAIGALQEAESLRDWVAAYPGTDAELLSDLAPVVAASVEAWSAYRELVAECEEAGGHSYEVLTADGGHPAGVVCSHCSSAWTVEPAPAVPAPNGNGDGGPEAAPPKPARKAPKGAPRRGVNVLRPPPAEPEPEATAEEAPAAEPAEGACEGCGGPVEDDEALRKANQALSPPTGPPVALCKACLLRCQENPAHEIESYDQAVMSYFKHRARLDRACAKVRQSGAA